MTGEPTHETAIPPRSRALQAGWRLWALDPSGSTWTNLDRILSLDELIKELDAAEREQAA